MITWRGLHPDGDTAMLHGWVTRPEARFWGMQGASVDDVRRAYREIDASPHHEARIGEIAGEPVCLFERYDPALSELADVYAVRKGDVGMHLMVAPTDRPVHGFTRGVLRAEPVSDIGAERVTHGQAQLPDISVLEAWSSAAEQARGLHQGLVDAVDQR